MEHPMTALFKNFARSDSGATLVEYGVALLVVIVVGTGSLVALANRTSTTINAATTAVTPP
jgi:Flp pilus assembly pilin Flp